MGHSFTKVGLGIPRILLFVLLSVHDIIRLSHHEQVYLMFQKILLPSLGNVNGYLPQVYRKCKALDENSWTCRPNWEELWNATSETN